jgi:hypothetical protein
MKKNYITVYKDICYNEDIGMNISEQLAYLTLTSLGVSDYKATCNLFSNSYDEIIELEYDIFYRYSKDTLLKLLDECKKLDLGKDVENFIKYCIESNCEKVFIEII